MDQLVRYALGRLTKLVNVDAGLTHSLDKDRAKEMLWFLHQDGKFLNPDEIARCVEFELGWHSRDAVKLGDIAKGIAAGKKPRITNPGRINPDIVEILKREMEN